ncbi:DUF2254 family protein [Actinocorallia longicatena]|uniref:DUF2254 domain-containing protein n=1 Tax=Actinocorallia longicatena TaxID=111803 RepID=A0ABP6QEJ3_9ACTN
MTEKPTSGPARWAASVSPSRRQVLFRRPRRRLRANLTQLIYALAGVLLGLCAPLLPDSPGIDSARLATFLFTVGFGVVSLASIIFSLLFLVVQFASSTFTPRLALFRDDPIVWRTFAFAVGVFVFTITAGLAISGEPRTSLLVPAFTGLLILVTLALMRTLQIRAFSSIQLAPCLYAISAGTRAIFDSIYTHPLGDDPAPPHEPLGARATIGWDGRPAVLQQLDVSALVETARARGSVIVMRTPIGAPLFTGQILAETTGPGIPEREVLRQVVTGPERSFDQDPSLGFRLLADIALRALSAAINDPATAVQALDQVEDLLSRIGDRELDIGRITDERGDVRLVLPLPRWEDYLATALDDVIVAAQGSPMTLQRIRSLLLRLAEEVPESRRPSLRVRLVRVEDALGERFPWAVRAKP